MTAETNNTPLTLQYNKQCIVRISSYDLVRPEYLSANSVLQQMKEDIAAKPDLEKKIMTAAQEIAYKTAINIKMELKIGSIPNIEGRTQIQDRDPRKAAAYEAIHFIELALGLAEENDRKIRSKIKNNFPSHEFKKLVELSEHPAYIDMLHDPELTVAYAL